MATGLAVPVFGAAKEHSSAPQHFFSVRPQTADKSLIELAGQARTTLLFPFELAQQVVLPKIEGQYTLEEALKLLLENSPLTIHRDDKGYLTIVPRPSKVPKNELPQASPTVTIDEGPVYERISVLGNRASARGAYDSSVPLDIIATDNPFFISSVQYRSDAWCGIPAIGTLPIFFPPSLLVRVISKSSESLIASSKKHSKKSPRR